MLSTLLKLKKIANRLFSKVICYVNGHDYRVLTSKSSKIFICVECGSVIKVVETQKPN